jgi:LmbE family N-acetylglucosaminyl deacetylase
MSILVISPHPDDAAFSTGGLLARLRGTTILVITCFSRSCTRDRGDAPGTTRKRALEDDVYANRIGARLVRLGLPDSGFRTNIGREELHGENEMRLRSELVSLLQPAVSGLTGVTIFVPLGIGGHPDHVHCREVALASFPGQSLVFYEDLPYGQMVGGPASVRTMVRQQYPHLLEFLVTLTPEQMERKMQGLDTYRSQLHPSWRDAIGNYGLVTGAQPGKYGERYWLPQQPEEKLPQWMPR